MKFITMALFLCAGQLLLADGLDTLRSYDRRSRFIYYRDSTVVAQAARFDLTSPGHIREIRLLMGGKGTGRFTVHIYGGEGRSAPSIEQDLMPPLSGRKLRPGVESVTIPLAEPLFIDDPQFFVVVDGLAADMQLLSDRTLRKNVCMWEGDYYYDQAVKIAGGEWRWGRYGYAVDVDVERKSGSPRPNFTDMTGEAHFPDSVALNGSIAWSDFNADGYMDPLFGGKLYKNNGDGTFADVTASAGIGGAPRGNLFIDVNNDARPDILFIGMHTENGENGRLFINQGDGKFLPRAAAFPGITDPTSFSLADIDRDGYLDLFIGQRGATDSVAGHLFLNDRRLGFSPDPAGLRYGRSSGSQFVDYDGDGDLDLYLADIGHDYGSIWKNEGSGGFVPAGGIDGNVPANRVGDVAGCSWGDYDNDGDVDLLYPRGGALLGTKGADRRASTPILLANREGGDYVPDDHLNAPFGYEPRRSGGAWGDANNDGLLDFIATTSCGCGSADLYEQIPDQGFQRRTYQNGLFGLPAGADAVWVDYDNDGRLDLSFFVVGRFKLYRNQTRVPDANHVTVDLARLADAGRVTGARVTLHAGEAKYTRDVTSGRGMLMQDPARLHFGIGAASRVDSVRVELPGAGGSAMTFTDVQANTINYLTPTGVAAGGSVAALSIAAYPNPFTTELRITYAVPESGHVLLEIFSIAGDKVATLVDAREFAGQHTVIWKAVDADGSPAPQGTYVYRLSTDHGDVDGRSVLAR